MAHQAYQTARRGFTYIELVTSLAISSILLLGLSSVILIGSRAIPTGTEQIHTEASVSDVLDTIAADLELATGLTVHNALSFTVEVPDRDADGSPEAIRYQLGAGSLYQRWNIGVPQIIIETVDAMTVTFTTANGKAYQAKIVLTVPSMPNPEQIIQAELFNTPEVR